MSLFNFIEDSTLNKIANQLWLEATLARDNELWVGTCALSGATAEVVLIAIFEQLGDVPDRINNFPLGKLIYQIKEIHGAVIPPHILSTAENLRDYRNLFHPGKARLIGVIEKEEAQAAYASILILMKWLNEWSNERFKLSSPEAAEIVRKNQYFGLSEAIALKNQMTIKQWQLLPVELMTWLNNVTYRLRNNGDQDHTKQINRISDSLNSRIEILSKVD
ncbi:hypothetical protein [Bacteroides sp.]|uniref:hypothetical protein n=1 Tax=Bacteroides sp. TaxID=29523 RepID=UPI002622C609|nr:hypothetical protein [Bacteroides sp.]MDD3040408.1 hypothetical protein [Bacteroides sp.]